MICPICNRDAQIITQAETPCECCKSIIYQNEELESSIIKSMVKFSTTNFIYGMISSILYLVVTIYSIYKNVDLVTIGLIQIITTGLVFLQQYIWYKSDEFKDFFDLLKALQSKRLKYYDWGSKIFITSLLFIALSEFGLLIVGLII